MELTEAVKDLLVQTAKSLKGSARRLFMARTVQALGEGGKLLAERELDWNRGTVSKGMRRSWSEGSSAMMSSPRECYLSAKSNCPTCSRISPALWMDVKYG